MRKRTGAILAACAVAVGMTVGPVSGAFAKITPAQPAQCTNGGGNQPAGQQPTCQGGGLTQEEATPALNPAGHAPAGQQ